MAAQFTLRLAAIMLAFQPITALASGSSVEDDGLQIPEPMVFDMIRPLGAARGELEANTLSLFPLGDSGGKVKWAPEVEYALTDGFAVEFELPFDGGSLEGYKFAAQGTIGTFARNRGIHGVQYIGVIDPQTGRLDSSLLYLAGARYSPRWSSLTMIGINRTSAVPVDGEKRDDALLINNSVFNNVSERTVIGVETNLRTGPASTDWLVMPQVHRRLSHSMMLQAGLGAQKASQRAAYPSGSLRLIREF